jgi:hypothetical protein
MTGSGARRTPKTGKRVSTIMFQALDATNLSNRKVRAKEQEHIKMEFFKSALHGATQASALRKMLVRANTHIPRTSRARVSPVAVPRETASDHNPIHQGTDRKAELEAEKVQLRRAPKQSPT